MANQNRLLVLGAGASRDLGFPLGLDLLKQILHKTCPQKKSGTDHYLADLVNKFVLEQGGTLGKEHTKKLDHCFGDSASREKNLLALREVLFDTFENDDWFQTNRQKIASGAMSIDHYLNEQLNKGSRFQAIAKYCIAYLLLGYEAAAIRSEAFTQQGEWYSNLWSKYLSKDWEKSQKQLKILTFNYERSFEHSLFLALSDSGIKKKRREEFQGQNFIQSNIKHIYGSLGAYFPSTSYEIDNRNIWFGSGNENVTKLIHASQQIDLMFNERKGEEVDPISAQWVEEADEIFFIGFGFDEANCKKIGCTTEALKGKTCLTTSDSRDIGSNELGVVKTGKYAKEFAEEWFLEKDPKAHSQVH